MGFIYSLISPSGKRYIGQTTRCIEKRFDEHCRRKDSLYLYNAIEKYGPKSFQKEILLECENEMLDVHEINFIKEFNTLYPNGYNIRTGGSSGLHCDASKEKMRQSKLGRNNHNFGKTRTFITKQRISEKKKGETIISLETVIFGTQT
jgi:group I intron endonuclease